MKPQFSILSAGLLSLVMAASLAMPVNLAMPYSASADPGIMKWDTVSTPGSIVNRYDVYNPHDNGSGIATGIPKGSEVLDIAVGSDGKSVAAAVKYWDVYSKSYKRGLFYSRDNGISWTKKLDDVFQVIPTTGAPNYLTATVGDNSTGPKMVKRSTNGGADWDTVFDGAVILNSNETIRFVDVSQDYGGKQDIGLVTVDGAGGGRWFVRSSGTWSTMTVQMNPNGSTIASGIDYFAIKFSPSYAGDGSVALVYADSNATYYNIAYRDLNANTTVQYAFADPGIEVRNPVAAASTSPGLAELNTVDLQLPTDFSGQSSSLRRAYISLDAYGFKTATDAKDGIFRIDDTTQYLLMDTSNNTDKSIYSIAYYGTYASGKLLAGERMGFPCTAAVPTWFTDSPTTCPIPCWYPALKPTTGAANQGNCTLSGKNGYGAAVVDWNADGSLALAATGSLPATAGSSWYHMQTLNAVPNDESAFAISRNNGETWNQLSLIDTTIDWFNDVAVAPDCTTIYLASANSGIRSNVAGVCNEFDSVWRASINPNVTAPLPAVPPLGYYWERVFTHTTSYSCNLTQTDLPILRVVPSCTDKKDGEIVGWAAQSAGTRGTLADPSIGAGVMAWSPDYGDYWAMLSPRFAVQDFAFESSTTLYVINKTGLVQRLPYTGTSWSTNLPSYDTSLNLAHTIVAVPDGKVLAGGATNGPGYPMAYSADKGLTFSPSAGFYITSMGNQHVIFDVDFKNNSFYYMGDDGSGDAVGTVYRNTAPSATTWVDNDMMEIANGGSYIFAGIAELAWPAGNNPPHPVGQFGLAQAWTGEPQPALYSAHAPVPTSVAKLAIGDNNTGLPTATSVTRGDVNTVTVTSLNLNGVIPPDAYDPYNSAVCRTLKPRDGMPKPGIQWDCLDIFAPLATTGVAFTLEPTSLKYCGCCTLDTNTTLYAIDDESGNWAWNEELDEWVYDAEILDGRWNGGIVHDNGYTPSLRQGMLWAYTDCLAKKGPVLKSPADKFLVGADPVTGRNQQVDLAWEQLCLSTWYQLQIAKDAAFTMRINPQMSNAGKISAVTGSLLLEMDATNMTSPAAWIAPGALPEAGAIYYWRIRSAKSATQQIAASPWSEARSFTVKAGFIVNTPYYGVQLLAPSNACTGCKVKPASFSWSPWKEATKYQFDLAKDSEFKTLVVTATTTSTGYEYSGTLDYSTNYFWRVKALEVNGLNIPSDWSATFSMQTEPAPAPPAPAAKESPIPAWVWVLIAVGSILVIVTLILVFKTRRI